MSPITRGLNFERILAETVTVNKMDAAVRQLNTAIDLFFSEGDVVSQHTLAAAAHEILFALSKKKGIKGTLKGSDLPPELVPNREEFLAGLRVPENFFKHGWSDHKKTFEFPYNLTQFFLYDALRLVLLLDGPFSFRMRAFFIWFQVRYPELLPLKSSKTIIDKLANSSESEQSLKLVLRSLILIDELQTKERTP